MNKEDRSKKIKELAKKYHFDDMLNVPFYKNMGETWLLCKEKTGLDPQQWLKKFDRGNYKDTGTIGWIDARSAIEAIFKKLAQ